MKKAIKKAIGIILGIPLGIINFIASLIAILMMAIQKLVIIVSTFGDRFFADNSKEDSEDALETLSDAMYDMYDNVNELLFG